MYAMSGQYLCLDTPLEARKQEMRALATRPHTPWTTTMPLKHQLHFLAREAPQQERDISCRKLLMTPLQGLHHTSSHWGERVIVWFLWQREIKLCHHSQTGNCFPEMHLPKAYSEHSELYSYMYTVTNCQSVPTGASAEYKFVFPFWQVWSISGGFLFTSFS